MSKQNFACSVKTKIVLAAMVLLMAPVQAQAADYLCDPAVFTLTPSDDGATMRLQGMIETPTPGYSAKLEGGVLKLTAPEGMVVQVVDQMMVDVTLPTPADSGAVEIKLEKTFNWGTDVIRCHIVT